MQIAPAFSGVLPEAGAVPVAATIRNLGPDARGVLHVSSEQFDMDYPVELPRGSIKRILTYPTTSYSNEISYSLSTNQGNVRGTYRQINSSGYGSHGVLMISQDEGELGFLRTTANNAAQLSDAYVKPEDAPDRVTAYTSLCAVILGTGAERLPDSVVRALHLYVSAGGTVVFIGGATSPTLTDPRWADMAPAAPGLPKTIERSPMYGGGEPFSILTCEPSKAASVRKEGNDVMVARRWVGLGRTLFVAFNPFEEPFLRWERRRKFFENILKPFDFDRTQGYLARFTAASGAEYGYSYTSYGYGTSSGYTVPGGSYYEDTEVARDPFSTKLPPIEKVFWILLAYFVVIIPVNFLFLKKLKKGELAWVTAPLISVGFAGAFFAAAGGLYTAKMSRATQGLLIATPSGQEALFVGASQMFFPQGGTYDLKMDGMESVGPIQPPEYGYYYGGPERQFEGLNAQDDGTVRIRNMEVNNLAFRELSYQQVVPKQRWFEASLQPSPGGDTLVLRNISGKALPQVSVLCGGRTYPAEPLAPGARKVIRLSPATASPKPPQHQNQYGGVGFQDLSEFTAVSHQIVIKVDGLELPIGPQIGDVVSTRERVTLAYFTGIRYGEAAL